MSNDYSSGLRSPDETELTEFGTFQGTRNGSQYKSLDDSKGEKIRKRIIGGVGLLILLIVIIVIATAGSDDDDDDKTTGPLLERYYLDDENAICNDGTPATYYVRDQGSSRWLLYLEGGFLYCWDQATCDTRNDDPELSYLMTSSLSTSTKDVQGLLSSNCEVNPDWCDANFAFIPYCSSDYFSGTTRAGEGDNPTTYHFMGKYILNAAIDALMADHGMVEASQILISGKGGGAVAVLFYLDRLVDRLRSSLTDRNIDIRGLSDTGWISAHEPFSERDCESGNSADCNIAGGVQRGTPVWNPELPTSCALEGYTWECFFGNYSAKYIETPVFISTFQFDYAQLDTDGCSLHAGYEDADCLEYAEDFAKSLVTEELTVNGEVETGFVPGCYGHEFIDADGWSCVTVDKDGVIRNYIDMMAAWYDEEHQHWMDLDFVLPAENPTCLACTGNA